MHLGHSEVSENSLPGEFLFDKYATLSLFNGIHARANELATMASRISTALAATSAPGNKNYSVISPEGLTPPRVWYSDCHVHCGEERVAMNHRPLLFNLFKALIDARDQELPRHQLIQAVYPRSADMDTSEQFRATAAHNLVKLVSRARDLAISQLNAHGNTNTRWFVYDLRRGVWRLRESASSC
jgi:hypothetical protein